MTSPERRYSYSSLTDNITDGGGLILSRILNVTKCKGEGMGSCKRCTDNGRWNMMWCCFLYKIDGYDGCYCYNCVQEIRKEVEE